MAINHHTQWCCAITCRLAIHTGILWVTNYSDIGRLHWNMLKRQCLIRKYITLTTEPIRLFIPKSSVTGNLGNCKPLLLRRLAIYTSEVCAIRNIKHFFSWYFLWLFRGVIIHTSFFICSRFCIRSGPRIPFGQLHGDGQDYVMSSRMKWYGTSIILVCPWNTRFFVIATQLWLPHSMQVDFSLNPHFNFH